MEKNKGTIREFADSLNFGEIALLNELLTAFGRIADSTKGDLLASDGDELIKLGVGTNDQVLTVDSGEDTGIKWATPSTASLSVKVGSFVKNTADASGDGSVTGVGFQPDILLFIAITPGNTNFSVGFDDASTHVCGWCVHVAASSATAWYPSTSYSIYDAPAPSILYTGLVKSFDSDGFTITWTKTGGKSGNLTVMYLALKV